MRRIARQELSGASIRVLASLQKDVDSSHDPRGRAVLLWKRQRSGRLRAAAFDDIRVMLVAMASGRSRCMYCEDSLGTDIDHFRPKTAFPARAFVWLNYLLACSHCNSNEKRAQFPVDAHGNPVLVDPTAEDPAPHLLFVPRTGRLEPMTPRGKETDSVFGLNRRDELTMGRADAWRHLERLVRDVGDAHARGDRGSVRRLVREAKRLSFQSVVHYFVRDALQAKVEFVSGPLARIIVATKAEWTWAQ